MAFSNNQKYRSTVVYLVCTPKAQSFIFSDKASMKLPLPKKTAAVKKKAVPTITGDGGWVAIKRKRSSSASASSSSSRKKPAAKSKAKVSKRAAKTSKKPTPAKGTTKKAVSKVRKSITKKTKTVESVAPYDRVIEIMDDSDADLSNVPAKEEVADRRCSLRQDSTSAFAKRASSVPNGVDDYEDDDLYADDYSEAEWEG
jgi:hypothetical protein